MQRPLRARDQGVAGPQVYEFKKGPIPRKILRVGVVSAFLHVSNSVMRDFGGTLARLPKDKFALYLIYLSEQGLPVSRRRVRRGPRRSISKRSTMRKL